MPRDAELVYTSAQGRVCPVCRRVAADCSCDRNADTITNRGPVRVRRETGGRRGKAVTLITGVPLSATELSALAKELKQKCSAGGTVKDGVIEIQGDHCEMLVAELLRRGWKAKRAGA